MVQGGSPPLPISARESSEKKGAEALSWRSRPSTLCALRWPRKSPEAASGMLVLCGLCLTSNSDILEERQNAYWGYMWQSLVESETPKRQIMSLLPSQRGRPHAASSFEGFWRSSSFRHQWPITVFFAGHRSIFLEEYSPSSAT